MSSKILVLLLLLPLNLSAQPVEKVTLEECLAWSQQHSPVAGIANLLDQAMTLQRKQLNSGYLPSAMLGVQGTWQSEVVSIPISFPGIEIPTPTQDQYKATLDVQQLLWDGGVIRQQKKVASAKTKVDQQSAEVQLYQLKEVVIQTYFGVLLTGNQLKINAIQRQNLQNRQQQLDAAIANGVAIEADKAALRAKILDLEQQQFILSVDSVLAVEILKTLTGREFPAKAEFTQPVGDGMAVAPALSRPELEQMQLQNEWIAAQSDLVNARNLPKLSLFATLGYGRPGLNFLSDEFESYAIVGGRLQWNLAPYYTRQQGREKELLALQQQQVSSQKTALEEQLTIAQLRFMGEVDKARRQREIAGERLRLVAEVRETMEAQHREGIVTYNDLLDKISEEQLIELLSAALDVQELLAVWRLKWATGGL